MFSSEIIGLGLEVMQCIVVDIAMLVFNHPGGQQWMLFDCLDNWIIIMLTLDNSTLVCHTDKNVTSIC